MSSIILPENCPILEQTADGDNVGRCYFYLKDGKTCPRHGDVESAIDKYVKTGKLTLERAHKLSKMLPPQSQDQSATRHQSAHNLLVSYMLLVETKGKNDFNTT